VGASYPATEDRIVKVLKGRITLIRDHWGWLAQPLGSGLLMAGTAIRQAVEGAKSVAKTEGAVTTWRLVWHRRSEWLAGYQ
jgi:hypothetical protein